MHTACSGAQTLGWGKSLRWEDGEQRGACQAEGSDESLLGCRTCELWCALERGDRPVVGTYCELPQPGPVRVQRVASL